MATELEHGILGIVYLYEPCTAYAVRAVFRRSLAARWSASAGAIYPAMRRLAGQGLLSTRARANDGRKTALYQLTARGRKTLVAWISPPLPPAAELIPTDPLRSRFRFLSALPPEKALAAAQDAAEKLTTLLAVVRKQKRGAQNEGDTFCVLAHRAAELALRAQLQWLEEVTGMLTKEKVTGI